MHTFSQGGDNPSGSAKANVGHYIEVFYDSTQSPSRSHNEETSTEQILWSDTVCFWGSVWSVITLQSSPSWTN